MGDDDPLRRVELIHFFLVTTRGRAAVIADRSSPLSVAQPYHTARRYGGPHLDSHDSLNNFAYRSRFMCATSAYPVNSAPNSGLRHGGFPAENRVVGPGQTSGCRNSAPQRCGGKAWFEFRNGARSQLRVPARVQIRRS